MTPSHPPRDRLLTTARELFTRRGFEAVSVRELAARARVNLAAVTYHFGSKDALYQATIASLVGPFVELVGTAARKPGRTALDRIEAVVREVLGHFAAHPGLPRILLRTLAEDRPLPAPMAEAMRTNVGVLSAIIADGQREGSIRAGDPPLLALSVIAQPFFFRITAGVVERALDISESDPTVRARIVEHVVLSVRRTIAATPMSP
jgi:AcrR family transcriptional regulator